MLDVTEMPEKSPTILVVEDDDDLRSMACEALADGGYFVQPARNGDIALIILQEQIKFDLLFTDIVMPGLLNGVALAREARRLQPRLKVLLTSGFSFFGKEASGAEGAAILPKPYRPSELLARIRALLGDN